jgi:DNA-binding transcriptional LysR family regulator
VRMRDIQILLAVADTASFTRAADLLRLSQPAISLAVKRFEEDLGVRIFARHGHNVSVSKDGERIIQALRKMDDIFQSSVQGGRVRRRIRIGISSLLSACNIVSLVGPLQQSGSYDLEVVFGASQTLCARDDLDLAVYVSPLPTEEHDLLAADVFWIGAGNGVFIRSTEETRLWEVALHFLRSAKIPIDRIVDVNSSSHAYELAAGGLGFTPCITGGTGKFASRSLVNLPKLPKLNIAVRSDDQRLLDLASALIKVGFTAGISSSPALTIAAGELLVRGQRQPASTDGI